MIGGENRLAHRVSVKHIQVFSPHTKQPLRRRAALPLTPLRGWAATLSRRMLHNGQNLPLYHTPISALFIADKNIYLRRASYGRGNRAPFLDSSASRARPGIACIKCAVSLDTYEPYARRLRNLDILTHLYPATNSDYSRLSLSLSRN